MTEQIINLGSPGGEERFVDIRLVEKTPRLSTYRALDTKRDCDVILKMFHKAYLRSVARLDRLRDEVGKLASVTNPHVVPILNFEEHGDHAYAAIGFVEGTPLLHWVEHTAPSALEIVRLVAEAADGVAAAHSVGVLHRNLLPSSILITEAGYAKVSDFGIAHFIAPIEDKRLTGSGYLIGTPGYTAPEIYRREPSTQASDVFALGVILYQCLCGCKPYTSETLALYALDGTPVSLSAPPPSCCCEAADETLDAIVLRAMALEPTDRYSSMSIFCSALLEWLREQNDQKLTAVAIEQERAAAPIQPPISKVTPPQKRGSLLPLSVAVVLLFVALFHFTGPQLVNFFDEIDFHSFVEMKTERVLSPPEIRKVIKVTREKRPPLHDAAARASLSLIRSLLSQGVSLDDEDSLGFTALHHSALSGQRRAVAILLSHGAEIDATTNNGETPLHLASSIGAVDIVELLLRRGADIGSVDRYGDTALCKSAKSGHLPVIKLLLARGANKRLLNKKGKTPGLLAKENGYPEVARAAGL